MYNMYNVSVTVSVEADSADESTRVTRYLL